jgi:predicted ATPase
LGVRTGTMLPSDRAWFRFVVRGVAATVPMGMRAMLKRVRIKGYKSLVDVQVELQPLSVLFGPNAAGKSNFLDALQLLSRMAVSRTLKEAFEPPYRGKPLDSFHFGSGGLDNLLQQESAVFSIEVDVELAPGVVASVDRQIREMRKGNPPETCESGELERSPHVLEESGDYDGADSPDGEPPQFPRGCRLSGRNS